MRTMRRLMYVSVAVAAMLACAAVAPASADQVLGKAANNAIYAQSLVNDQMTRHPELLVIGMHASKPGVKASTMIASNLDRIGKADDEDDLAVAHQGKANL